MKGKYMCQLCDDGGERGHEPASAQSRSTDGLGVRIQLHVKRELFSFHCKQDWFNKAQSRYANCGVRKGFYITLDAGGRVIHMGKCFETASYPVTVYELETTWVE
jgi:hypothetical protein